MLNQSISGHAVLGRMVWSSVNGLVVWSCSVGSYGDGDVLVAQVAQPTPQILNQSSYSTLGSVNTRMSG